MLLPSPATEVVISEPTIQEIAWQIAIEHEVDLELIDYIIQEESQWNPKARGDMSITCPIGVNKGQPVEARGLLQITKCYYPDIKDSFAYDPELSLIWAMPLIKATSTCISQWSTCKMYYER